MRGVARIVELELLNAGLRDELAHALADLETLHAERAELLAHRDRTALALATANTTIAEMQSGEARRMPSGRWGDAEYRPGD
jgi:hypothetical protein